MTSETNIARQILLAASSAGHRLFRQNVGQGWIGKSERITTARTVTLNPGDVIVRQARPLHAGLCTGSSDTIGWTRDGLFAAVEVKTKTGRASADQIRFIEAVRRAGGVAGVARSDDEALRILDGAR